MRHCTHATISHIERKIDDEDNSFLLDVFVIDEFRATFSQMHNDKFAGLHGLNPTIYKKLWDVLSDEIFSTFAHVFYLDLNEMKLAVGFGIWLNCYITFLFFLAMKLICAS